MLIKRVLITCGLATGLTFSVYSIFMKFRGLWCRGHADQVQNKAQKVSEKNKMLKSSRTAKPLRMWIDGKCFNIRKFKRNTKKTSQRTIIHADFKNQTVSKEVDIVDVEYKNEIDIVTDDNGKVSLSFHLPSIYYIKLHQFTEFDIKHLSDKTQTNISWPRHGQNGKLSINGHDKKNIEDAVNEIHSVIGAIREQLTAAQFISIPILSKEVQTNFEKFKAEILNGEEIKGMHESIFQSPLKLHLTIIVFALSDEREKAEAVKALEEYKDTVLCPLLEKTGPLRLRVEGIDCMQSNYKKTDVLFANVKIINETDEGNLQKIANDIANHFYEKGLVLRHTENVKLHMTLINTKYRKSPDNPSPSRKRWVKRESFDASLIMQKYKDFVFGECDLDSIHLSLISTKGEDGFYKPLSIIKI
ncbi:activating signal cointegrator 1 complex subunit 1-like [Anoplophora glabripennis]|uniref:activating signal cointegrator 1 complex subunit 1-like n=1 Tax=Anoplophora glabripennis TaxID=217634 RepID=UPI000874E470|nr:activating signal cointegrator 1 complex subunit 1-like [Anoplophora glabripennis]